MIFNALLLSLAAPVCAQGFTEADLEAAKRDVAILKANPATEHSDLLNALINLQRVHYFRHEYKEAIDVSRTTVALQEKQHGPNHPDTADALVFLAFLLGDVSPLEAGKLYKRIHAIQEEYLGPDHQNVAETLHNLSSALSDQGEYSDARLLLERALKIYESTAGPESLHFAATLLNLGALLDAQTDYSGAHKYYARALEICEGWVDPNDTSSGYRSDSLIAAITHNLALLQHKQGFHDKARPLYEKALAQRKKMFGSRSPDVAESFNSLAVLEEDLGNETEARSLYEQAIAIREVVFGPTSPDLALVLSNLGGLLREQGLYAGAQELFNRSLAINEANLGENSPSAATDLMDIASILQAQNLYSEARPLLEQSLRRLLRHLSNNLSRMAEPERFRYLATQSGPETLLLNLIVMGSKKRAD